MAASPEGQSHEHPPRPPRPAGEHARMPIQLERLPFASLDPQDGERDQLSLSLVYGDQVTSWQVRAMDADGAPAVLPGPFGNDVWVALGRVWNGQRLGERDLTDPLVREIALGYLDLLQLMDKSPSQTVYAALEETVERLGNVRIVAQGTWKDGEYIRERVTFPLFDMTRTLTRRDGNVGRNVVTFRLSLEVAKAVVHHSRLLDTRQLYRLKSGVARKLYRLLEAERFNRDRRGAHALTVSLADMRLRLPIKEVKPAQIKRTLGRAHAELQRAGLLVAEPTYASEKLPGVRAPVVSVTYRFPAPSVPVADVVVTEGPVLAAASPSDPVHRAGASFDASRDNVPTAGRGAAPSDYPGRAELAALLGVAIDTPPAPVSDLAWWVGEIERTLGDRRSSGFYKQVVEAFAAARALDDLEFVLRGVKRDAAGTGSSGKAVGAAFTARLKVRALELGIVLPGAATAGHLGADAAVAGLPRGGGVTPISALLPRAIGDTPESHS